jgi:IMP dehydrogenase
MATTPKSRSEKFTVPTLSASTAQVMDELRLRRQAVTFDEITLADRPSSLHPNDTRLHSWVSRNIRLKGCGIMSAAMDTVTEAELALALAKSGGIGVIHRNLDAQDQAGMVRWVRRKIHYGGMIDRPITFSPSTRLSDVQCAIRERGFTFTSFPIVDEQQRLVGMLTRDEMDFVSGLEDPQLGEFMKPLDTLVHAPIGITTAQAFDVMRTRHVKKLPVLDAERKLKGMFVWSDIKKDHHKQDKFSLDEHGNFYVGAAIGVGPNDLERAARLIEDAHCPLLVIDSSHGACLPVLQQIAAIRTRFGDRVDIIAGNVASYESAMYLLNGLDGHRPDGLKVGIGPGTCVLWVCVCVCVYVCMCVGSEPSGGVWCFVWCLVYFGGVLGVRTCV